VSGVLRKVKVVAARAGVGQLDEWVTHELEGYPDEVTLPEYRGPFGVEVRGHYSGPFNSGIKNGLVPSAGFPEDMRGGWLFKVSFLQPIAELEELSRTNESTITAAWPADVVAYTNMLLEQGRVNLYEGMGLQSAWRVIPRTAVVAIVDQVRTKILDLALELEKTAPNVGQADGPAVPADTRQTIITNIYGGNQNVAVGSSDFTQSVTVNQGDWAELSKRLAELGVPQRDIEDLQKALHQDGDAVAGELGPETSKWLGRLMPRAEGLGIGSAGGVIANLISQFLGIG
jgi:hypothetical protein